MLYYEVLPENDQKRKYPHTSNCEFYIAHELYTHKDIINNNLNFHYCTMVDYSKKKSYWMFGTRFNSEQNKKRGL